MNGIRFMGPEPRSLRGLFSRFLRVAVAMLLTIAGVPSVNELDAADATRAGHPVVASVDRFAVHGDVAPESAGRVLLTELNCTACHQTQSQSLEPKRAPRLSGVGNRVRPEWLRSFLQSPQDTKPGTTMPDVLSGLEPTQRIAAIDSLVAYLANNRKPFPSIKASGRVPMPHRFWQQGDAGRGREMFHQFGCVACHDPDPNHVAANQVSEVNRVLLQLDEEEIEDLGMSGTMRSVVSVPLPDLAAKYTYESLTYFLFDPHATRPDSRMPNLKLTLVQAADIVAYLLSRPAVPPGSASRPKSSIGDPPKPDGELVNRGRQWFVRLNCVACHGDPQTQRESEAQPKSGLPRDADEPLIANGATIESAKPPALDSLNVNADSNCLANPDHTMPRYPLNDGQRSALTAALKTIGQQDDPASSVLETMLRLNCLNCHQRDGLGGVGPSRQPYFETFGHVDLGDEGRLPPPLTHVGAKLQRKALVDVLAGNGSVRPYLLARMPQFQGGMIQTLPDALASVDQLSSDDSRIPVRNDPQFIESGRRLLDNGCVQCHPIRSESLPGVVGIDLASVPGRVRAEWFERFLRNPSQWKPRTRMPTFFPDGTSSSPSILRGNVDDQIAAIWAYLNAGDRAPLPEKVIAARMRNYELLPEESPILLRTFMQHAGTHAIAVGFPQRVHYAFDARELRLASAWRGRFLDAYATWFVRFVPMTPPLGQDVVLFPKGAAIAVLAKSDQPWPGSVDPEFGSVPKPGYRFGGYLLDRQRVPTFQYSIDAFTVHDRIEPQDSSVLVRRLNIQSSESGKAESLWLRASVGESLDLLNPNRCRQTNGSTIEVTGDVGPGQLIEIDGKTQWRLPVIDPENAKITIRYRWAKDISVPPATDQSGTQPPGQNSNTTIPLEEKRSTGQRGEDR